MDKVTWVRRRPAVALALGRLNHRVLRRYSGGDLYAVCVELVVLRAGGGGARSNVGDIDVGVTFTTG
jgi:hypothetical protein